MLSGVIAHACKSGKDNTLKWGLMTCCACVFVLALIIMHVRYNDGAITSSSGVSGENIDTDVGHHVFVNATGFLDFSDISAKIHSTRELLETYYGGDSVVLGNTFYLRPGDIRYEKGLDYLADKIARALVWKDKFVVGAIGSSVTAGHDNCNYDSYERQWERTLGPVFAAAGVKFTVRNAGQGGGCGDSFENQVPCIQQLVGDDVDATHYSWTYFEHGDEHEWHELFYRYSLLLKHGAMPLVLNTGDCDQFANTPQVSALLTQYADFGADLLCMQQGIKEKGYPGKQWGAVGDGLHNTTRYGETLSRARRNSLGVVFRNWHPGPLLFQTVADVLAYRYTTAMLRALKMLLPLDQRSARARWPKVPPLLISQDLPPVMYARADLAGVSDPPGCLNLEEPTYGPNRVVIMEPLDPMNPDSTLYSETNAEWSTRRNGPSTLIPREDLARPECQHLDVCVGLFAPADYQVRWMTFRLPRMEIGYIKLCGWGKSAGQLMLDAGIQIMFDGAPIDPTTVGVETKCLVVTERFPPTVTEAYGHLHMSVRFPLTNQDSVAITHVITL